MLRRPAFRAHEQVWEICIIYPHLKWPFLCAASFLCLSTVKGEPLLIRVQGQPITARAAYLCSMTALLFRRSPDILHALGVSLSGACFKGHTILGRKARQSFGRLSILPIRHLERQGLPHE